MSFLRFIVGIPLIIAVAVVAFMNNAMVDINPWPFEMEITASLSVIIVFLVLLGYIVGRADAWVSYTPLRAALRNQLRQNKKLNAEQQKLVEKVEGLKVNLENIKTNEQPVEKEVKPDWKARLKQKFTGFFKAKPKQDDFWCL